MGGDHHFFFNKVEENIQVESEIVCLQTFYSVTRSPKCKYEIKTASGFIKCKNQGDLFIYLFIYLFTYLFIN